jgi:DNA invertase Pin-like site-specific DNA recombinase
MIYGYCRISTAKQSIERQIRNIGQAFPSAVIIQEAYSGTSLNRPAWSKLYSKIKADDVIVFDSVSRMSRNAAEGFALYKELFDKGVKLVFLKERHIDTDSYQDAMNGIIAQSFSSGDAAADELVNAIMAAVNRFMMNKVEQDIFKAFEQSEKEVADLRQRTREGIVTARLNGKQIGAVKGTRRETKKGKDVKAKILMYSRDFGGSLSDKDCMKLIGIANNTYYKYKKELRAT